MRRSWKVKGIVRIFFLKVLQAIKNFDTSHGADMEFADKAKQKYKDIVYWIYLASTSNPHIKAIPTTITSNSRVREEFT